MTPRFERVKNFVSSEECAELNDWVDSAVTNKQMGPGMNLDRTLSTVRFNTRFYANRTTYPDLIYKIFDRIQKAYGLSPYKVINHHGKDGIVVSCTFPTGIVFKHTDPKGIDTLASLRFNFLTRAADGGGELVLEGNTMPLEVGELHCYLVTEHEHWVTEVLGVTSRIMWQCGVYAPKEDWDSGLIKFNNER
jgi:hypothetical protein